MPRLLPAAIFMSCMAAGCGDNPTAPSAVVGRTWKLASIERNGQTVLVSSPDRYTLRFEDERLAVRSDCNSCGGPYKLAGVELRVGPLACTRAYCGPESLDAEFSQAVGDATFIAERNRMLVIQSPGATLRFTE